MQGMGEVSGINNRNFAFDVMQAVINQGYAVSIYLIGQGNPEYTGHDCEAAWKEADWIGEAIAGFTKPDHRTEYMEIEAFAVQPYAGITAITTGGIVEQTVSQLLPEAEKQSCSIRDIDNEKPLAF